LLIKISQSINLSNIVLTALNEQYQGMNIMPAGDTQRALGHNRYVSMLHYYQQNGVVRDRDLKALKNHVSHMRYLIFMRITKNNVSHSQDSHINSPHRYRHHRRDRHHHDQHDHHHGHHDHHHRYHHHPQLTKKHYTYRTTRAMASHIVVYDIQKLNRVWSGSVDVSRFTENNYDVPIANDNKTLATALVSALANTAVDKNSQKNMHYPGPPSDASLLKLILAGVTAHLPKPA
jgi:hypothetical protein